MNQKQLAEALNNWFVQHRGKSNNWNRLNPVGFAIKNHLISFGNWKNAPRGNPHRGGEARKEQKLRELSE